MEAAAGFPDLLDLLEKHSGDKLSGVELGDIEWYHRLRNTLYHDGNGVTVDPDKVDAYNQIARLLFEKLFGDIATPSPGPAAVTLLGEFVAKWSVFESRIRSLAAKHLPKRTPDAHPALRLYDGLINKGVVPSTARRRLEEITSIRNSVVHGITTPTSEELKTLIGELDQLITILPEP